MRTHSGIRAAIVRSMPIASILAASCGGGTPAATSPDPDAMPQSAAVGPCASRQGGAEIVVEVNGEAFRLWSESPSFIEHAAKLKASGKAGTAMFRVVLAGTDCDPQWSWHVDAKEMAWPDVTMELCDGRPSDIERDVPRWIEDVKSYCPWSARVRDVEDRSPSASR
jgi:hypothetical protein